MTKVAVERNALALPTIAATYTVHSTPIAHRVYWISILNLHVMCCVHNTLAALVYVELRHAVLGRTLELISIGMKLKYYALLVVIFAMIGGCHAIAISIMVVSSIASREFVYSLLLDRIFSTRQMQIESHGPAIRSVMRFLRWLFGPQGFFGIKGPHFRALFLSQQLVLVVFRAYQASQLSASVPHVLTVWSYSALVVAHCWSFLVIRRLCNHSPGLVRLCFVLSDACLGIITTIIFPAILATKYVKAYDSKLTNFPIHLNQDAVFSATMVVELHRILVASWTDLFVRIVMSISILISLGDAKVLLEKVDARSASDTSPHLEDIAESAVVPESKRPITLVLKLVIFAVGATILAFQLKAQQKSHNHSCVLPVHPWGTGRPGCALIRLNCTLEGIQGSKDEVTTILTAYSPDSVQVLELLSCPALRIPSYIQSFGHLMRIYMKKSHLVEWDVDAALTRAYHPRLSTLQIQDSQLPNGLIPPGLMDPDFPPNLRIISLLALNLVDLPLAVAAAWPPGTVLRLESMNLTQIPPVLFRMALYYLSLENTALTEIPVELFYTSVLMYLNLKGNPLTSFPAISASTLEQKRPPGASTVYLDISDTGIREFPSSFGPQLRTLIAHNTPLCVRFTANDPSLVLSDRLRSILRCQ